MQYQAHIEEGKSQSLRDHILGTARRAYIAGAEIGIGHITELIALLHDLGKYSDEFQTYLRNEEDAPAKGSVNHSSAGAEFLTNRYGKNPNKNIQIFIDMLSYAISAHHGMYDAVGADGENLLSQRLNRIAQEEVENLYARWCEDLKQTGNGMDANVAEAFREFGKVFLDSLAELKCENHSSLFYAGCFERLLLSIQIDSDWKDTAIAMGEAVEDDKKAGEIFHEAWKNYYNYMSQLNAGQVCQKLPPSQRAINQLRYEIQNECLQFTENDAGIYRLPIPTGAGKTLSSLGYALKMATEKMAQGDEISHIFYISPYLSITEQNAQVIKNAVGNEDWVMEHHSNVSHLDERENQLDTAWKEPVICTTMVQFLNTLFSDKKKSIRRFHQLKNAVIIVDEVQSLPIKTLHTFNLMMNFLNKICHTTIVLCTATQPALDAEAVRRKILYSVPYDMVHGINEKFMGFNRNTVECRFLKEKDTLESLGHIIQREFSETRSVLVICNRKKTVSQFYEKMRDDFADKDVKVFYLTTYICAEHRSSVIQEIKERLAKHEKLLIISTNLIEAGVDLSVEHVYRSLAGLDSIAQAAGRCNRNGEMEKGCVTVMELEGDEPGSKMEELIAAQGITREIAYRYQKSSRQENIIFPKWMQQYYEALYKELNQKMDFNLHGQYKGETIYGLLSAGFKGGHEEHVLHQAFATAGREYQTIAEEGFTVLVPYKEGERLVEKIEQSDSKEEARKNIRRAQRYTVSLYEYEAKKMLEKGVIEESNVLSEIYIAKAYDSNMGLTDELPLEIY